jgi:serine/threonine protein kinase
MATGKKAFEGKSQASLVAAILEHDPPPIAASQPLTPPALDHIVRRCLAKDPDDRWQSARDLTDELKWITESRAAAQSATVSAAGSRSYVRIYKNTLK